MLVNEVENLKNIQFDIDFVRVALTITVLTHEHKKHRNFLIV
jgi:hypothetical protein